MLLVRIASSFIIKELSGISGGILFLATTSALSGGAICSGSSRNRIYPTAKKAA
jgi:predicted outer membrane repeat protein